MASLPPPNPLYTTADFKRNAQNAAELAEAIRLPALTRALQALVSAGLPATTPLFPGVDPITSNALANQRREGFYEFYTSLLALTIPSDHALIVQPEPWAHVKTRKRKRGTPGLPGDTE